jgi:hypothetical protein
MLFPAVTSRAANVSPTCDSDAREVASASEQARARRRLGLRCAIVRPGTVEIR